jgi:hypothetical protein
MGLTRSLRELGDMVFNVEPMAFPSKNIGGEFVGKVSIVGLLPKLDAGTVGVLPAAHRGVYPRW